MEGGNKTFKNLIEAEFRSKDIVKNAMKKQASMLQEAGARA